MKKTFAKILSFIMILAIAVSVLTFNVSAASVTVGGAGEYEVGKSFNVAIRFNADATLYAVEADISYNSSVLRLNSVSGAEYSTGNGTIKIVDDAFTATKPSKSGSYTLNFTAIAAGNSNISVSVLGGGEAESKASGKAAITVVTPKPSSNANLASIKLSSGVLSPAFNANTTSYSATVKHSVDSITITGAVADGGATYVGGGTFGLNIGDNSRVLTVTAADGTKKSYTINIKRMTEQETLDAEQAERDADPLLVVIDGVDYTIVNDFTNITIPAGYTQGTTTRKDTEIAVLNDEHGEYTLYWLTDANGENGAFYTCDENDKFTRVNCIRANGKLYIIEQPDLENIPDDYVLADRVIDGKDIEAYAYIDESLKEFYVVKCYVDGARAYYRFDSVEGTMQRAAEFDLAVKNANTIPLEEQNTGKFAWFTNMNTTGKAVFMIIVLVAVILIVVAILLIVKIASVRNDDFEEEFMSIANNDFILNDFADEASDVQEPELLDKSEEIAQETDTEIETEEQKD